MPITINPAANVLTLNPTDVLDETIAVTIPKGQRFTNVNLVPSASIVPFITSIDPPGGHGSITGEKEQTVLFRVKFRGIPCKPEPQVVTGTLDVVAEQRPVAKKTVQITVPPCAAASEFVYSVKFVCGVQPECACDCAPVLPGHYATEINIHNVGRSEVVIRKRFIPVVLAGAAAGRDPRTVSARAEDSIVLPAHMATMEDCCRIAERLLGAPVAGPVPLTIGLVELAATAPLAVTAVYTAAGLGSGAVSINVQQIAAMRA